MILLTLQIVQIDWRSFYIYRNWRCRKVTLVTLTSKLLDSCSWPSPDAMWLFSPSQSYGYGLLHSKARHPSLVLPPQHHILIKKQITLVVVLPTSVALALGSFLVCMNGLYESPASFSQLLANLQAHCYQMLPAVIRIVSVSWHLEAHQNRCHYYFSSTYAKSPQQVDCVCHFRWGTLASDFRENQDVQIWLQLASVHLISFPLQVLNRSDSYLYIYAFITNKNVTRAPWLATHPNHTSN